MWTSLLWMIDLKRTAALTHARKGCLSCGMNRFESAYGATCWRTYDTNLVFGFVLFFFPILQKAMCPGFGQDRVNFHRNPGRDTAGRADPTWPNRAGYPIPCAAMLGSGWGELGGGNSLAAWERTAKGAALSVVRLVLCFLLICIVVVTVSLCCSVKLPLSRPTGFCMFLPILLHTPEGGGAAA